MRPAPVLSEHPNQPVSGRVPFNDLSHQWHQIRDRALPDMSRLFEEGAFCLGPFVQSFEASVAEFLGTKKCDRSKFRHLGASSGADRRGHWAGR
jgi:hypothetical protein